MPQPATLQRHGQSKALLDKALELGTITVPNLSGKESFSLANRLFSVISRDRKESRKIYQPEDPEYNASPYDQVSIFRREVVAGWCVIITTDNITGLGMKVLGPDGEEVDL